MVQSSVVTCRSAALARVIRAVPGSSETTDAHAEGHDGEGDQGKAGRVGGSIAVELDGTHR
jgi:hypothetical protein